MPYDSGTVIMAAIFIAVIMFQLVFILRRAVIGFIIGVKARMFVSGGFFLTRDKGARLAYKGVCDCFKRNYEKAIAFFEKAMKYSYDPQNCVFCLDWMTRCYDAEGKSDRSLGCCVRAVEVSPGNIPALFNLAERYLERGQLEKARFYYEKVLKYDEKKRLREIYDGNNRYVRRGLRESRREVLPVRGMGQVRAIVQLPAFNGGSGDNRGDYGRYGEKPQFLRIRREKRLRRAGKAFRAG